jgi:hypothetical protein
VQAFADLMNRTLGKLIEMDKIEQSRIEEFRSGGDELAEELRQGRERVALAEANDRPWRL